MAAICPVCNKKVIGSSNAIIGEHVIHASCIQEFRKDPEKYGGQAAIEAEKEHQEQQQKIEDKSVYVKGFRMPFGEMVTFIFKWTMASIPTAIFLAILFLIFTAIFA